MLLIIYQKETKREHSEHLVSPDKIATDHRFIEGAGHSAASSVGGETYWKEVEMFITKSLK